MGIFKPHTFWLTCLLNLYLSLLPRDKESALIERRFSRKSNGCLLHGGISSRLWWIVCGVRCISYSFVIWQCKDSKISIIMQIKRRKITIIFFVFHSCIHPIKREEYLYPLSLRLKYQTDNFYYYINDFQCVINF